MFLNLQDEEHKEEEEDIIEARDDSPLSFCFGFLILEGKLVIVLILIRIELDDT